jgi:large subunit ribosomal protein L16
MGKGKGAPSHWVCKVKTGKVLFEVAGITEEIAKEAVISAGHKLPCMSRFIKIDHF